MQSGDGQALEETSSAWFLGVGGGEVQLASLTDSKSHCQIRRLKDEVSNATQGSSRASRVVSNRKGQMNRQEHIEHLKAELDEWNEEIDQLEARARKANAALEYQKKVATIKEKRDEATHLLSRLERADDSAWEAAKGGAAELWEGMKGTFEETKQAFREGLDESR